MSDNVIELHTGAVRETVDERVERMLLARLVRAEIRRLEARIADRQRREAAGIPCRQLELPLFDEADSAPARRVGER